jgi:hypothetical protein
VPALAAMLVRVTERRRERSEPKFRPWSREVRMDRNSVETIGHGCCVKPPVVVNWPPRGLCSKYRRCNFVGVLHSHNQIPDMGRRRDSQVAAWSMSRVTKVFRLVKALRRPRKLMAYLGQGEDLRSTGDAGPASVVKPSENPQAACDHLKLRGCVQQSSSRQTSVRTIGRYSDDMGVAVSQC